MTINQAITAIEQLKPHQYTDEQLVAWISQLDLILFEEIVKWHEGCEDLPHGPYGIEDMDAELLVPDPYSDIYLKWISAQIDQWNGDALRFNNSMTLYNFAMQAYADWLNREYKPLQRNIIKGVK